MNEIKIINFINYTLEHYSGDVNDLDWSTEEIQTLLLVMKKLAEAVEKHENETRAKFSSCVTEDDETLWKVIEEMKGEK